MRQHLGAVVRWCGDAAVRLWPAARVALASYWTAGTAWAVMTALHGRWLLRSAHAGEVLSAYGAGLVVLGLVVAARPFIRAGVRGMAEQIVPPATLPGFWGGDGVIERQLSRRQAKVDAAIPDVWAERVIAVAVVVAGTLLNSWATPLARRWGLPL